MSMKRLFAALIVSFLAAALSVGWGLLPNSEAWAASPDELPRAEVVVVDVEPPVPEESLPRMPSQLEPPVLEQPPQGALRGERPAASSDDSPRQSGSDSAADGTPSDSSVQGEVRAVQVEGESAPVPVRVVRRSSVGSADLHIGRDIPSADRQVGPLQIVVPERPVELPVGPGVGRWVPQHKGVVVKDIAPFLNEDSRSFLLEEIARDGFSRLLLAIDGSHLALLRDEEHVKGLHELLRTAEREKIVVDLLLRGDWQTPHAARDLQELLKSASAFPWRRVILDSGAFEREVADLPARYESFMEMLYLVADAYGQNMGVAASPQLLEYGLSGKGLISPVGDNRPLMEVAEIVVRIHSTDAATVVDAFQKLARQSPELSFSLSQSVAQDLPRENSYFSAGIPIFSKRMQRLCFDLSAGNAEDLIVDAWEDFCEMLQ